MNVLAILYTFVLNASSAFLEFILNAFSKCGIVHTKEAIYLTVGQMIKEKRKAIGLTQREFAEEIGIATITLQQYERGVREPKLEMLMRIASKL